MRNKEEEKELKEIIKKQLHNTIDKTNFLWLGKKIEGKVRDSYIRDKLRVLVTSDRLSCFDVVVASVPFKGQVLNAIALYWFNKTKDIAKNHIVDVIDPNVIVVKECQVLPVEVIVRGYLTGSAWRDYQKGLDISGIHLPKGLKMSEKFPTPLITPSTKAIKGEHDMPISEEEILKRNLVDKNLWEQIKETSLNLFNFASNLLKEKGLILVDTKYEFGILDGELVLVDEIHTLDSSRFWIEQSYQECFERGIQPEMLDKEPIRQWLLEKGFSGSGEIPEINDELRSKISLHYINSYYKICDNPIELANENPLERIENRLKSYFNYQD